MPYLTSDLPAYAAWILQVVTLAWTDPPVGPGASEVLVNDLDLNVSVIPVRGRFRSDMLLAEALELPRMEHAAEQYWGNEVSNPRPHTL